MKLLNFIKCDKRRHATRAIFWEWHSADAIHAFKHLDDARAFIASTELVQAMSDAGVLGKLRYG